MSTEPRMSFQRLMVILCILAVLAALFDQLTKWWVRSAMELNDHLVLVPGIVNLVRWRNTGIAFGLFQGGNWILTVVGIAALAVIPLIFYWEWKKDPRIGRAAWGIGLILGGALGNLIDRLRLGAVTDFIDVYIGSHHWPAFNVADSCICVGTALVFLLVYWLPETPQVQVEGKEMEGK